MLYTFGAPPDGAQPLAGLIDVSGTLYGTTYSGGKYGDGTVFKPVASSKDKVLHNFPSYSTDGEQPLAGLIDVNGTLYGTTKYGGKYGYGTVFSVTTASSYEHVLYPFGKNGGADAEHPYAGLVGVGGTLYGTTLGGGVYGHGTVFSVTTSGTEKVLYSFGGSDGADPSAALTNVGGTLYGTTELGGKYDGGTVFSVTTSGTNEKVLHSFGNGSDGDRPAAGLIYAYGLLYGTTYNGGTKCPKSGGCGTVFNLTTDSHHTETVLHNFGSGADDGANPYAALTNVSGELFGTTLHGGKYSNGTVYQIDLHTSGYHFNLLHDFGLGSDGRNPYAAMIYEAGNLIGTTGGGGSGYGTVFSQWAFMAMAPCSRCHQRNAALHR
ncbi:MAG: choice-of-anchor tandem repeat GloVer-containing protein [Candidatus Cybelea sp.]